MPVRRAADPLSVQYVWDAIKNANQQKQVADFNRLIKYIQKYSNCSQAQAELYIKQTLQDDLILEVKKIAQKGNNVGNEVESYRIHKQETESEAIKDGHDWYCIECHLAGDVTLCRNCYRVFHTECSTNARQKQTLFPKKNHIATNNINLIQSDLKLEVIDLEKSNGETERLTSDYIYDETLCSLCNLSQSDPGSGIDLDEFNYLLNFILDRIKSWVPDSLTSTLSLTPKYEWHTQTEISWRAGQLFYHRMNMSLVELKIRTKEYTKFSQFQADVVTMMHNVAIFHGVESQEYGAAELMILDMKHDISELQNCIDCYKHSNEKINNRWFCLPCRIPHKLVWAKQKGYPYWPAKVIRETDTSCDVRFFSGKYERSVLPKNCIKPIDVNINTLQIKKTATFNKAVEELALHQKLLENPGELAKIQSMVEKKPKKSIQYKPKKNPPVKVQPSNSRNTKSLPNKRRSFDSDDVYEFDDSSSDKGREPGLKRKSLDVSLHKIKRMSVTPPAKSAKRDLHDVIHISDAEDDKEDVSFPFFQENSEFSDSGQEQVTSSTELEREDVYRDGTNTVMQKLEQPYSDAVEKMRRRLETCKDKNQLISMAMNCMQLETDRLTTDHNENLKKMFEIHNNQISETKKKQWCFNCEQDAIYHCCWNTAYCSPMCQQQHWQAEHKKVCRRKR